MSSKEDKPGSSPVNIRFIIESVLIIALITGVVIAAQYTKAIDYGEKVIDDIAVANLTPNVKKSHPRVAVVAIDENPPVSELTLSSSKQAATPPMISISRKCCRS